MQKVSHILVHEYPFRFRLSKLILSGLGSLVQSLGYSVGSDGVVSHEGQGDLSVGDFIARPFQ